MYLVNMETDFVPLSSVVDLNDQFKSEIDSLETRIENENIPSWLLIPDRNSGEHATDGAWMAAVWGLCSSGENTLDARIAWDTRDRARQKSDTGQVPNNLREKIVKASEKVDNINMTVLRITFDIDTRELLETEVGFQVEEN